ncbi:MAG: fumarylacetoacetate hydrolase family protein [Rhodobacteraceae bacterium]|nr:fumarylacetoacetate hydrolase family protein [Paracoccaceae bacterium]
MGDGNERALPPRGTEELVEWLAAEHARGAGFTPFAAEAGLGSMADAYEVQAAFVARIGAPSHAGWKIALTAPRMQALLGIDTPVSGVITSAAVLPDGHSAALSSFGRLGVECEICLGVGAELPPDPRPRSLDEIARAVAWAAPAFELVDDRRADYATADVLSLVADNAWNAGVVLGPRQPLPPDLQGRTGRLFVDDVALDEGPASDALGGPLQALSWLAAHLGARGETMPAGSLVMTGSLVPTRFPDGPGAWRFEVEGMSSVRMSVG